MSLSISSKILSFPGQLVKGCDHDLSASTITIRCERDKRYRYYDPITKRPSKPIKTVKRIVRDLPLYGFDSHVEIELAQVKSPHGRRLIEACPFVDKGERFTNRFCQMISGLCRHMSIKAVSTHLNVRWETVKNIDKAYLQETLPALDPSALKDLKYIGVDEVARAKGHDYMTVVYDMVLGRLIWVETGRDSDTFASFLKQLPSKTAAGIEAIAMDMGPAYQKAVRECLPEADIVFDRFHVMQNYSKAISNQRKAEFKKADKEGKDVIKGCHYLLLKNKDKLTGSQADKLLELIKNNENLCSVYVLKEQLQALWDKETPEDMRVALDEWCLMARSTNLLFLRKFARSLERHAEGICNYAKHKLTSGRIEAGNVGIGMIRKRARGIKDTEYFKLKIRQASIPETCSMFYFGREIKH